MEPLDDEALLEGSSSRCWNIMSVWDCFSVEPLDEEALLEGSDLDEAHNNEGALLEGSDQGLLFCGAAGSGDEDMEWALSDAALGGQPEPPAEVAAPARGEAAQATPKRKRRRRVAAAKAVPIGASRSEICRAAANARWAQRTASAQTPAAAATVLQLLQSADAPAVTDIVLRDGCCDGADASLVLTVTGPALEPVESKDELDLHRHSKQLISAAALSKQLGIHVTTIQRKMKLMASVVVLATRFRALRSCQLIHAFLLKHCVSVIPSLYVVKQQYDGVKLKLRVSELPPKAAKQLRAENKSSIHTQLMQVLISHAAVWQVDGRTLEWEAELPTVLKPMGSSHAEVVKDTVISQAAAPEFARQTFQSRARISCCDDHTSNAIADASIFSDDHLESLIRWICSIHKGHKCSELGWLVFRGDQKGILAAAMVHQHAGRHRAFLSGILWWLDKRLLWHDYGDFGPGEEAERYNAQVEETFGHSTDDRLSGPKAAERQKAGFARRRLLNGRRSNFRNPEHMCRNRACCRDREHCLEQIRVHIIEPLARPQPWAANRWLGVEDATDFVGLWLMTFGLYIVGVLVGFCELREEEEILRQLELILQVGNSERNDSPQYLDVTSTMTDFERQNTHVSNIKLWLATHPAARLWILRALLCAQQGQQKMILRASGANWEKQQLKLSMAGMPREFRPLMAHEHKYSGPCMDAYGKLLTTEESWEHLPDIFKVHMVAMDGFRGGSRAACAEYQLIFSKERQYPAKRAGLASFDVELQDRTSDQMIFDYHNQPCVMDPRSFDLVAQRPHRVLLMSPVSIAEERLLARLSQLDNASVECNNASIRRRTARHVQATGPDMGDVSAEWVHRWSRCERTGVYGDVIDESDSSVEDQVELVRGGGRCRAYFQRHKDQCRFESGFVDFAKLHAMYKVALQDPNSEEMLLCAELGKLATIARRGQAGSGDLSGASAFGTLHTNKIRSLEVAAQDKALLLEHDGRLSANQEVRDGAGMELAVRGADPMQAVHDLVVAKSGPDLGDQIRCLDRLCRVHAARERRKELATNKQLQQFVNQPVTFGNLPWHEMDLPAGGKLKLIPGTTAQQRWLDPCDTVAQEKCAELSVSGKKTEAPLLLEWFERVNRMTSMTTAPLMQPISEAYKPTHCFKSGGGVCLCSGEGITVDIARPKCAHSFTILCEPKSRARYLLTEAYICALFQATHWVHVGLFYLHPIRPTFLALQYVGEDSNGVVTADVVLTDDKKPKVRLDVELMRDLDLKERAEVVLFKLLVWQMALVPFSLGRVHLLRLKIALDDEKDFSGCFWKGRNQELLDEAARRRHQRAKLRAKAKAAAAKPKASPKLASRPTRPSQRPRGAGLPLVMPEDLPALEDDASALLEPAAGPAPAPRLMWDGHLAEESSSSSDECEDAGAVAGQLGVGFQADWEGAVAAAAGGHAGL